MLIHGFSPACWLCGRTLRSGTQLEHLALGRLQLSCRVSVGLRLPLVAVRLRGRGRMIADTHLHGPPPDGPDGSSLSSDLHQRHDHTSVMALVPADGNVGSHTDATKDDEVQVKVNISHRVRSFCP